MYALNEKKIEKNVLDFTVSLKNKDNSVFCIFYYSQEFDGKGSDFS